MSVICANCGKEFTRKSSLNRHLETACKKSGVKNNVVIPTQPVLDSDMERKYKSTIVNLRETIQKLESERASKEVESLKDKIAELTSNHNIEISELNKKLKKTKSKLKDEYESKLTEISINYTELIDIRAEVKNQSSKIAELQTELLLHKTENFKLRNELAYIKEISVISDRQIDRLTENFIKFNLVNYTREDFLNGFSGACRFIKSLFISGNYKCIDVSRNKFSRFDGMWITDNGGLYIYEILRFMCDKAREHMNEIYLEIENEIEELFDESVNIRNFDSLENLVKSRIKRERRLKLWDEEFIELDVVTKEKVCRDDEEMEKLRTRQVEAVCLFSQFKVNEIPAPKGTPQRKLFNYVLDNIKNDITEKTDIVEQ